MRFAGNLVYLALRIRNCGYTHALKHSTKKSFAFIHKKDKGKKKKCIPQNLLQDAILDMHLCFYYNQINVLCISFSSSQLPLKISRPFKSCSPLLFPFPSANSSFFSHLEENMLNWLEVIVKGFSKTYQLTISEHGGVVSDPLYA